MTHTPDQPAWVMVPREPTEDMMMAARGLIMARDMRAPNTGYSLDQVATSGYYGRLWAHILSEEERAIKAPLTKAHLAQLIYRAMIAAAPSRPDQEAPEPVAGAYRYRHSAAKCAPFGQPDWQYCGPELPWTVSEAPAGDYDIEAYVAASPSPAKVEGGDPFEGLEEQLAAVKASPEYRALIEVEHITAGTKEQPIGTPEWCTEAIFLIEQQAMTLAAKVEVGREEVALLPDERALLLNLARQASERDGNNQGHGDIADRCILALFHPAPGGGR